MIPAWIVVLLSSAYAVEYVFRFLRTRPPVYYMLGNVITRSLIAVVFVWVELSEPLADVRAVWIRLVLVILLTVDIMYIGIDHIVRAKTRGEYER